MEQQGNNNNDNNTDQTKIMVPTDLIQIQPGQPSSDSLIPYGIPHYGVNSDSLIPYGIPHYGGNSASEITLEEFLYIHAPKQHQLHTFWNDRLQEVETLSDFKNHSLPLARIKKIMKLDEDVRMITAEAPVVFARACEMFILELTLRGWDHTEIQKRRILQKNDIAAAIARTDIFDFLVDTVPREAVGPVGVREGYGSYYIPRGIFQGAAADHGFPTHHHQNQNQNEERVYVEQRPRAYVVARPLWEQLDQGEVLNEQEQPKPSNDS